MPWRLLIVMFLVMPLGPFVYGLYKGGTRYLSENFSIILLPSVLLSGWLLLIPEFNSRSPPIFAACLAGSIALPLSAFLWYRAEQFVFVVHPGVCRRCGYDLTGNTSGVCPECGTSTTVRR